MRLFSLTIGILAVALLIFSCSAATLSVENGHVDNAGESATVNITLDSAPDGLSGYLITVSVIDPSVANLESVAFPAWAALHFNGTLPSGSTWIVAADTGGVIVPGSTNVTFATFTVKGLQAGSTNITIDITEIDDYEGDPFVPAIQPGTFTVGVNYTINATAGAGGAISPSGLVSVPEGADQTFNITPDMGYAIDDVVVDSVSQGAVASYTFTNVQMDHTIEATFSYIPVNYIINATAGAGGTISPSGSVSVLQGTDKTFNITPDMGYAIDDVLVDSVSQGAVASYTFTNVQMDHTIEATFSLNPANKATLYVASYPTGATIYLDGLNSGQTDQFVYHAPAGVHNLTLAKGGYAPKTVLVTIPSDGLKVLAPITLQANGGPVGTGTLYIASIPSNAVIYIDSVEYGHTNQFAYGVPSGTRNLTLVKEGYQVKTTFVEVPAGALKVLAPITLSPL